MYPDYEWLPWQFNKLSTIYWNDVNNIKMFLEWAAKKLNINKMSDWYSIPAWVLALLFILDIYILISMLPIWIVAKRC